MKIYLKGLPIILLSILIVVLPLLIYKCNDSLFGKDGYYTKQKQQCISEQSLRGCEQAGADVEEQLRRCEWAFTRCVNINVELQERLKGD